MDDTFRGVCRPIKEQQQVYSRYKRHHGIKFQRIVLPDGIIGSFDGPYKGRLNDWKMWQQTGIEKRMRRVSNFKDIFKMLELT